MKIDSGYIFVILFAPILLPILIPLVLFLAFKKASYETRKMRRWTEDEAQFVLRAGTASARDSKQNRGVKQPYNINEVK